MTKQVKPYYHVTTFEGWIGINKDGLKASEDGYIYVLDTRDVDWLMARHLVDPMAATGGGYGLFEINPEGFTSPVETDTDGIGQDHEWTLKHQFRFKQPFIEKKYIKPINMFHHKTSQEFLDAFTPADKPKKKK